MPEQLPNNLCRTQLSADWHYQQTHPIWIVIMKELDFLIIGAQKAGTTTLFELLRKHPAVSMPLEKEVPFFSSADCDAAAWEVFGNRNFHGASTDTLWGKASPQYMCDPQTPQRIKALMPDVKLVAILRDPIRRTWSHYQMGKRRDTEERGFETAVCDLLDHEALELGRNQELPSHENGYDPESDFYVAWSEYGRILSGFLNHFDRNQMLILYTEDLKEQPEATLDLLLAFLGLAPGYRPASLGREFHRGGSGTFIPHTARLWLRRRAILYRAWKLLPDQVQGRLRFRYEQLNIRKTPRTTEIPLTGRSYENLRAHFVHDFHLLSQIADKQPDWADTYSGHN